MRKSNTSTAKKRKTAQPSIQSSFDSNIIDVDVDTPKFERKEIVETLMSQMPDKVVDGKVYRNWICNNPQCNKSEIKCRVGGGIQNAYNHLISRKCYGGKTDVLVS